MLEALDNLRPNEVYVATGGSYRDALWGELMSTRAQYLHAAGAMLNGFVRDAAGIEALGFAT
jgi:regulator of RNase E activity RraA